MKLSLIAPLVICCTAFTMMTLHRKPETDWQKHKLKGKVKSVRLRYYTTKDSTGIIVKNDYFTRPMRSSMPATADTNNEMMHFNETGMITAIEYYRREEIQHKELYSYDGYSMLTERKLYYARPDMHGFENGNTYAYTGDGMVDSVCTFYNNDTLTPFSVTTYTYNRKNLILQEKQDNNHHSFQNVTKYGYDSLWHITSALALQYDKMNRDGTFENYFTYAYDSLERRSATVQYRSLKEGDWIEKDFFSYDTANHIVQKKIYYVTSKLPWWNDYTYDKYGNVTQEKTTNPQGKVDSYITYTYKYDSNGNWTRLIITPSTGEPALYEREIIYY